MNKLSIPAISSAVRQAEDDYQLPLKPSPEKPIPITREQIREKITSDFPASRSLPLPKPNTAVRQESRPVLRPVRPIIRQELDDIEENIPRQPIRPKV